MLTIFQNLFNAKEPGSVECYLLDILYSPPLYRLVKYNDSFCFSLKS